MCCANAPGSQSLSVSRRICPTHMQSTDHTAYHRDSKQLSEAHLDGVGHLLGSFLRLVAEVHHILTGVCEELLAKTLRIFDASLGAK